MVEIPQLVVDLALLMGVAAITTIICKLIKQPVLLGYVIAGFLISPTFGWVPSVSDAEGVSTWSEIGMIFLMFGLGLEFSIVRLSTIGKGAFVVAITVMGGMMLTGMALGTLLGWSFYTSLFLGGMLSISSTMIVSKVYDELGLKGTRFADLALGALVTEDIVAIFLMVVLSTIAVGSVEGGEVVADLSRMVLYLVVWFVLAVLIVPSVLKRMARVLNNEILITVSVALCLVMVVVANAIGFSAALGAFLAGSILAGTTRASRIEELFKPIKDLFGAIFFVSVGMMVSPFAITKNIIPIVIIVLVVLVGMPLFSGIGALLGGQSLKTAVKCGLSLSQVGEFSFIIAALGVSLGVTDSFLYPVIVTVSVVTTLTTPFYIRHSDGVYRLLVRLLPQPVLDRLEYRKPSDDDKGPSMVRMYVKHWALRLAMVVVAAIASVEVLAKIVKPLLRGFAVEPGLGIALSVIGILITGVFMSNLFYGNRKGELRLLWLGGKGARAVFFALTLVAIVISSAAIVYIVYALEGIFSWWLVLLAFLLATGLARSKAIHSGFLRLEASFLANLNANVLAERKAELDDEEHVNWVERQLYVVQAAATGRLSRRGLPRSADYLFGFAFNLDLIAIERDGHLIGEDLIPRLTKEEMGRRINDPEDPLGIHEGDLLTFMGTEDEIDSYLQKLLKDDMIEEDEASSETLERYLRSGRAPREARCFSFEIDSSSEFRGKTINAIDFMGEYGSMVVAFEHNALIKIKPSRHTLLSQGDRVWVLADCVMAAPLMSLLSESGEVVTATDAPSIP